MHGITTFDSPSHVLGVTSFNVPGHYPQGLPPRVNGTMDAFRKIVAAGGVAALWRGCWPNVQRAALVNLGDLSTYDSVKSAILRHTNMKDNSLTHCLSSACAG